MLLFKDAKAGYPVYILHKDAMNVKEGRMVAVGQPHVEPLKPGQMAPSMQRMVDVTIEVDGKTQTYSIPESLSVTYAEQLVIATEREDILREVRATRQHSLSVIESVERHKQTLEKCDAVLSELDVEYKQKRQNEERMDRLETGLAGLRSEMSTFLSEVKKMMS